MIRSKRPRQLVLFVTAVLVPAAVLIGLGIRVVRQDTELSRNRLVEDRRRATSQLALALTARVEAIRLQEVNRLIREPGLFLARPSHRATVLIAEIANDRVILPWERTDTSGGGRLRDFDERKRMGESKEFADKDFAGATRLYGEALAGATRPSDIAEARLLLARAQVKAGRTEQAFHTYRELLDDETFSLDEEGVPYRAYAAERLLTAGRDIAAVHAFVIADVDDDRLRGPAELYLLQSLVQTATGEKANQARARLATLTQRTDQVTALANDLPRVRSRVESGQSVWMAYGDEPWLVTVTPAAPPVPKLLFAVSTSTLGGPGMKLVGAGLKAGTTEGGPQAGITKGGLQAGTTKGGPQAGTTKGGPQAGTTEGGPQAGTTEGSPQAGTTEGGPQAGTTKGGLQAGTTKGGPQAGTIGQGTPAGEALGDTLPGLRVEWEPGSFVAASGPGMTVPMYAAGLVLVLGFTILGGYLLLRDVNRDMRVAEMRSQFVASVSHELKTPLTAIRMFAETLALGRSKDPRTHAEYLETIVNECERLARLVDNVLDFSKIEQGKKIYRMQPTNLADVARSAARTMQYPLSQQGFSLRVSIDDEVPALPADADAMEQAILNLLTNAMKYSGEARDIELRLARQNGAAVIEVEDHGLGIPREEQARIFEKYYRVRAPETMLVAGTGLGLTLVSHIVTAHGGRLELASEPNAGSTFSILIPLQVPSEAAHA